MSQIDRCSCSYGHHLPTDRCPGRGDRRYIVGSTSAPGYELRSTHRAPIRDPIATEGNQARFPTSDDGTGRLCSLFFLVKRGVLSASYAGSTFVVRETDDPEIVAKIDAAKAAVEQANAALRQARNDEVELLAVLAPRCKPARLR